ncbi:MAG TPA: hypothetical protein VK983_03155 [Candidatus Limnocylindrales bacterium]|nr:hypothetical protein [Candidatus Limnocylindrales bacterium]
MNTLWVPEKTPPQVTESAEQTLLLTAFDVGIFEMAEQGTEILHTEQEPLASYIDRFGFALNKYYEDEASWAGKVLKVGASIGVLAYRDSGFYEVIDDACIESGTMLAKETGIPEAYAIQPLLDPHLASLLETIQETPLLGEYNVDPSQRGGYAQVLTIGAGCVRHYLQQALAG